MSELVWPETTSHGAESRWAREGAGEWRDDRRHGPDEAALRRLWVELASTSLPGVKLEGDFERITGGPGLPGRHCWYCGSIHPGDLHELLTTTEVILGGADWKYGWPHKFYVETPNPRVDGIYVSGSSSGGPCKVCRPPLAGEDGSSAFYRARCERKPDVDCAWCAGSGSNPSHVPKGNKPYSYPSLTGKFYNAHLEELEQPAFDALTEILLQRTGVRFSKNDAGKLTYRCPRPGYQA